MPQPVGRPRSPPPQASPRERSPSGSPRSEPSPAPDPPPQEELLPPQEELLPPLADYDIRHVLGRLDQLAAFCGGRRQLLQVMHQWGERREEVALAAAAAGLIAVAQQAAAEPRGSGPAARSPPAPGGSPAAGTQTTAPQPPAAAHGGHSAGARMQQLAAEVCAVPGPAPDAGAAEAALPGATDPEAGPGGGGAGRRTQCCMDSPLAVLGGDPWSAWITTPLRAGSCGRAVPQGRTVQQVRNLRSRGAPSPRSPAASAVARVLPPAMHNHPVPDPAGPDWAGISEADPCSTLVALPGDVRDACLSWLCPRGLARAAQVAKAWYIACSSPAACGAHGLWRTACRGYDWATRRRVRRACCWKSIAMTKWAEPEESAARRMRDREERTGTWQLPSEAVSAPAAHQPRGGQSDRDRESQGDASGSDADSAAGQNPPRPAVIWLGTPNQQGWRSDPLAKRCSSPVRTPRPASGGLRRSSTGSTDSGTAPTDRPSEHFERPSTAPHSGMRAEAARAQLRRGSSAGSAGPGAPHIKSTSHTYAGSAGRPPSFRHDDSKLRHAMRRCSQQGLVASTAAQRHRSSANCAAAALFAAAATAGCLGTTGPTATPRASAQRWRTHSRGDSGRAQGGARAQSASSNAARRAWS
eukprot:TRINITY_DN11360_c0_g1_i1.p2 TRINITY_DN11360_c0_g1~~TRINITY_DN11360_c0_g1_i1.p2  ORF type:complete len:664 (+),score=174.08 TRINITY_DN11360_c0_g1_i1:73-1992(+)